jgi:hypothetical protein
MTDYGNKVDIEQVRERVDMQGEAIGPVKVDGGYALLEWWGRGGGEALFEKRHGHWERITGGGGCLVFGDLRGYGVTSSVAQRFMHWFPCGPQPSESP